nr:DUF4139 domain-containing protein [uncultured Albidiferax sp.]
MDTPSSSRITDVTLYPGSAKVERVARAAAGSHKLVFACLPGDLEVQSLAVAADASVQVGELSVEVQDGAALGCATSPLDARIRELEDKKSQLGAENDAQNLVQNYLKSLSNPEAAATANRAATDPKTIVAVADALRRTGQDGLLRQAQILRLQEDLDRQLKPLLAERTRSQEGLDRVLRVAVTVDAPADAPVRLSYQIQGPGWTPSYRALIDTATRQVRLERQALVAQATGENWQGVRLRLSTGQPRQGTTGPVPQPWQIGIQPPPQPQTAGMLARPMAAAAPAPMVYSKKVNPPLFDVGVFNNAFATEFSVPQAIDVPSNGQRVALALGRVEATAQLFARTTPSRDASAWLVAELALPEGVWPVGPLQLYRDGAFVGTDTLRTPDSGPLTLSLGRDELVRVQVDPQKNMQATAGFVGSRAVRTQSRSYSIENRHRSAVQLQVLEATPVAVDENVSVKATLDPQPTTTAWRDQPGVALWSQRLEAGTTARFSAAYEVSYPKDARLSESR